MEILTNIELHQIEQSIKKIEAQLDILEDDSMIERSLEILNFYQKKIEKSFKKARISESNLKLVIN